MKNTLSVQVNRKGSGFLLSFNHDDRPPGQMGMMEDVATDLKDVRGKIDKFLDEALAQDSLKTAKPKT